MNTALFSQYQGLGDIVFTQAIAQSYINKGYKVVWPVKKHFLEGLQRAYPFIQFVDEKLIRPELFQIKEIKEVDGTLIVPIRWSDNYKNLPYTQTMRSKYLMCSLDHRNWRNDAMWVRDKQKEDELFYNVLKLTDEFQYNFISLRFGSNFESSGTVQVQNGLPNIELTNIDGYSLFDWAKVFERATNVHMISSSNFYMLELLTLSAKEIHLYSRNTNIDPQLDNIRYLITKPMILHENYIPCRTQHLWGGIAPLIDENIMQEQNVELIGKTCDCKKIVLSEGKCNCPGKNKWELKYLGAKS